MSIFSQMWEHVQSGKRDENQKRDPQNRLARLEALEERQLLTVAPGAVSTTGVYAEVLTNAADSIDLTSLKAATNGASFEYVDAQGIKQTANNVTVVNDSMNGVWRSGWYVVNSDVVINDANVQCNGDVKLILADDCSLTVTGAEGEAGIGVSGGRLTVYGQTNGTGVLNATGGGGDKGAAGIGGDYNRFGGNVTINGGQIYAQGTHGGAGIGGGEKGAGQNITINAGYVEARGGENGAGVGGGGSFNAYRIGGNGVNITVNGGTVKAYGGENAAGIGGGGSTDKVVPYGGSGINITINGGDVEACGGSKGAGIGGGNDRGNGTGITINDGNVLAYGSDGGAGIGGGRAGKGLNIKIDVETRITSGDSADSADVVTNTGRDVSSTLNGNAYVLITQQPTMSAYVTYVNEKGETESVNATVVNDAMRSEWKAGWYVVNSDVTMTGANVWCNGEVKLILADGCTLTVTGAKGKAGITVEGSNSLKIYGQTKGTGVLKATGGDGDDGSAGIGGSYDRSGGNVTINGGQIYAKGTHGGAGIGGGEKGHGRNITINAGYVEARGGEKGAGIGGGGSFNVFKTGYNGENITINGGTVKAYGGERAAGIGGGGPKDGAVPHGGDGINITINGGDVEARGGSKGAGIGGGNDHGDARNITINGGTVKAYGSDGGSGIGGGASGSGRNVKIKVGFLVKTGATPESTHFIANSGEDLGSSLNGNAYVSVSSTKTEKTDVAYVDENGASHTVNATVVTDTLGGVWNAGWYVVNSDVTLSNAAVTCKGDVKLILADGCTLNVTGANGKAGISVTDKDNKLTIYGQKDGTGVLRATGGGGNDGAAGIGGNYNKTGENITINGGKIYAQGTHGGAGIGGGEKGIGQEITINAGYVEARGGDKGAGIGGGGSFHLFRNGQKGQNITFNGGTVKAYGGERAAGIGGGGSKDGGAFSYGGKGFNIVVNGGNVEAHGGSKGAGIGGGNFYGAGENITINGGIVKAYGSNSGSGIGGGNRGMARKIVIKGGNVEAHGGSQGAGIGGGFSGYGENISIEGGFVKAYASNGGSAVGSGDEAPSSASSVKITTASIVTAGDDAKSAKKIVNDGTDLALELSEKKYVSVTPKVTTNVSYVDAQNSASLASLTNLDIVFGTAQDEDWFI